MSPRWLLKSFSKEAATSLPVRAAASLLAIILMSTGDLNRLAWCRKYSRQWRLIRFLITEFPTRLLTVTPSRLPMSSRREYNAIKWRFWIFLPFLDNPRKADRFSNRWCLGNRNPGITAVPLILRDISAVPTGPAPSEKSPERCNAGPICDDCATRKAVCVPVPGVGRLPGDRPWRTCV